MLQKARSWNDELRRGATHFFVFVASLAAFKTPFDLLNIMNKPGLVAVLMELLAKDQLPSVGSNLGAQALKSQKQVWQSPQTSKATLQKLLMNEWPAMVRQLCFEGHHAACTSSAQCSCCTMPLTPTEPLASDLSTQKMATYLRSLRA